MVCRNGVDVFVFLTAFRCKLPVVVKKQSAHKGIPLCPTAPSCAGNADPVAGVGVAANYWHCRAKAVPRPWRPKYT